MQRDFFQLTQVPQPDRTEGPSPVLITRGGWRAQDGVERAALQQVLASGPLPHAGLAAYAGFPWSAWIDSLSEPEAMASSFLRSALRTLALLAPRGAGLVTVCAHPALRDHLGALATAGITDVFWTGATAADLAAPHASGITLHALSALALRDPTPPKRQGPEGAFALCPAENGGNTPALWSAIAAGLIPVLSLEDSALPGPAALWQAATLPPMPEAELAETATPERLAALRGALANLQMQYGGSHFVHDVLLCLTARSAAAHRPPALAPLANNMLAPLIELFAPRDSLTPAEAQRVLRHAAIDLLAGRAEDLRLRPGPATAKTWRLLGLARAALPATAPEALQLDSVLSLLAEQSPLTVRGSTPTPALRQSGPLRVFLLGPRGQRTPISYAAMRPHLAGRIDFVAAPEAADLIVTGWNRDLEDNREMLATLCGPNRPRLAVLSEEPLWDSLWSGGLAERDRLLDCGPKQIPYRVLNHVTSDIFRFGHLPWFVLSDDRFAARYALLMAEFAALTPRALLAHWGKTRWQAAFLAERREGTEYAAAFPAQEVAGLCLYRSRVAEWTPGPNVLRIGQGWAGTPQRRQDLPDWHLDKLALLHGKVRVCGAQENTLQRDYITEKPFDAFAIGAIPAVVANEGHRLNDLILPEAMLNTAHLPQALAAARIASFTPDLSVAEAWHETVVRLLARFRDTAAILHERQRIADACVDELRRIPQSVNPLG